eukprot:57850_1
MKKFPKTKKTTKKRAYSLWLFSIGAFPASVISTARYITSGHISIEATSNSRSIAAPIWSKLPKDGFRQTPPFDAQSETPKSGNSSPLVASSHWKNIPEKS